jgi:hypothetical protein
LAAYKKGGNLQALEEDWDSEEVARIERQAVLSEHLTIA